MAETRIAAHPARSPVLILGMHRSGTSMIARALEDLGLFLGWRKQGDHEALFFLALNNWLLEQVGGRWDHPEPVQDLVESADVRALAVDYLRVSLRSPRAISFLGPGRYLRHGTPERLSIPWGFKDPRTTFTLPLWLDLFPAARIVHVRRHGVDVAASLRSRHRRILSQRRERFEQLRWTYRFRPKRSSFTTSVRCADIERGFELWEAYAREADAAVRRSGDRALDLRYEDFLSAPLETLTRLSEFCELPPDESRLHKVVADIRADRAYAYRQDPEMVAFAERVKQRLARYGY